MAEQSWRWITEPIDGNPDNGKNILVEGEGLLPGPRVILECGNIDAEDMDKIAAVPELIAELKTARTSLEWSAARDLLGIGALARLDRINKLLARLGGEGVADAE